MAEEEEYCSSCYAEEEEIEQLTGKGIRARILIGLCFVAAGLFMEYIDDFGLDGTVLRIIFLIGLLIVGGDVIWEGVRNVCRHASLDEKMLMSIAALAALAIGYWTESVAVMTFYQIGEVFEGTAVGRSRSNVKALIALKAPFANAVRNGEIVKVRPEDVSIGEILVVRPGEMVPIDGTVVEGSSYVDTKAMTGEPVPRRVEPGDRLLSGFINTEGALRIRTDCEYQDSSSARVLRLIGESSAKKSRPEKFITRFARWYTPAVVALAAIVAVLGTVIDPDNWEEWVYKAVLCLVVSCPCALVVSIPLTYYCGIGRASREGVLFKGSSYIETIAKTDKVVFDKTGTLTKGVFEVVSVDPAEGFAADELVTYAAAAESLSEHPIAKSITSYAKDKSLEAEVTEAFAVPGMGVRASVDGKKVIAGNAALMEEELIEVPPMDDAVTNVFIAVDGRYAGCIGISDSPKDDSAQAVEELHGMGIKSYMFTGDSERIAKRISDTLGLDGYRAEMLPQDKTVALEDLMGKTEGKTCFVGDGINDSPSLARADAGIAMGGIGSDSAVEAADAVIMDDRPSKVATGVRISRKTQRIVMENIVISLAIKFTILALTPTTDLINMWIAIFGDVGVLIIAVCNSFRALGFAPRRKRREGSGEPLPAVPAQDN
ncbi:MAG: heavy metal translocating P-type ATPase [Methanomethylophilus sp.]|jgi:Cd2+/Zn2+-exporting ATPase